MIRARHALVALILLPSVAGAQMGRAGSTTAASDARRARAEIDRENMPPMKLKVSDLEDMSPVKLLIDERKDLKLTDDQHRQLEEMQAKLEESNAGLMTRFDSMRIALRPHPNPSDEDRLRAVIGREELSLTVRAIRANHGASVPKAMALLDDSQKATAQGLLEKQAKETDDVIRSKLGARAGWGRSQRLRAGVRAAHRARRT